MQIPNGIIFNRIRYSWKFAMHPNQFLTSGIITYIWENTTGSQETNNEGWTVGHGFWGNAQRA